MISHLNTAFSPLCRVLTGVEVLPLARRVPHFFARYGYVVKPQKQGRDLFYLQRPSHFKKLKNLVRHLSVIPKHGTSLAKFLLYKYDLFPWDKRILDYVIPLACETKEEMEQWLEKVSKKSALSPEEKSEFRACIGDLRESVAVLKDCLQRISANHPLFSGNIFFKIFAAYFDPGAYVPPQEVPAQLRHLYGAILMAEIRQPGAQLQSYSYLGGVRELVYECEEVLCAADNAHSLTHSHKSPIPFESSSR